MKSGVRELMAEQIAEARRREDEALAETAGIRWTSYIGDDGVQQRVIWPDQHGDAEVEVAPDPVPQAGSSEYLALLDEMKSLHIRKNAGYAGMGNPDPWANFRMAEGFGVDALRGVLVRLSDKYIRVQNLLRNPDNDQVGESIDDTLMDLSAYALIAICIRREQNKGDGSRPTLDDPNATDAADGKSCAYGCHVARDGQWEPC